MIKNKIITIIALTLTILALFVTCVMTASDSGSSKKSSLISSSSSSLISSESGSSSSSSSSNSAFSFVETFNNVPDGTNIRSDQSKLDNPSCFPSSMMSGTITAGTTVSGSGAITLGTQRMAFIVPGLGSVVNPVLKVTIKNDDGKGVAVPNLNLAVGDSYSTSGAIGETGYRAHGSYPITNTNYEVITINLNTAFTSTNIIQFRGIVGTSGTAGLHIDKIEITGTLGSSSSSSSSTTSSTSSSSSSYSVSSVPPAYACPIGYATLNGGTTGGYGGDVVYVSTGTELQNAINVYNSTSNPTGRASRTSPRIIYVIGKITLANSGGLDKIEIKGSSDTSLCENLSIIGVGTSGELEGIGIKIWRAKNIIIQNLKIHHVLYNTGEGDAINISGPASNIWIDHCEFYNSIGDLDGDGVIGDNDDKDYYDGLLDIKYQGSQYITVSHCIFRDSYKTSLIGYSTSDARDWKTTFYANYYYNCNSRLPLIRGGGIHILNNYYYNNTGSGTNLRCGLTTLIERNYYKDSKDVIGHFYDDPTGYWDLGPGSVDSNYYDNVTWSPIGGDIYSTAYSTNFQDTGDFGTVPYSYTAKPASDVPTYVLANAGVGKL